VLQSRPPLRAAADAAVGALSGKQLTSYHERCARRLSADAPCSLRGYNKVRTTCQVAMTLISACEKGTVLS